MNPRKPKLVSLFPMIWAGVTLAACGGAGDERPPARGDVPNVDAAGASAHDAAALGDARGDMAEGSQGGDDAAATESDAAATKPDAAADAAGDSPEKATNDGSGDAPSDSGDGSFDAHAGEAGVQVNQGSDASQAEPSCDPSPTMTWSAPVAVMGVPTFATQPIVTMTTDELTVAWVLDAGGGVGNVFVADRASPTDAFPAPLPLSVGGAVDAGPDAAPPPPPTDAGIAAINYFAFERVAFSDDGRTLIGVSVGGRHLAEFIRVERGAAFFPQPMESRFTSLESTLNAGEVLADPVSSASGTDLVYSRYGSGGSISVYESVQNGSSDWPTGTPQEGLPLALLVLGEPKRPTSMTNDQLTLFVWDEASNAAYGVFRGSPNTQFNFSVRYGAFFSAQVNADCSRLYYVAQGTGGYTLEHVDAQ